MNRPNTTTGSIISSATMKKLPVDSVMMKKPSSSLRKPSKAAATIMMEQKNIHFPEETIPESVKEYSLALQRDLKINSLYDIQNLTNIAREEIHNAKHIAKAICTRIKTANDDEKLPSLYLLDSIAKNVGGAYITEFTNNLVDVFYYSFKAQTKIETQTRYLKLLKTWEPIFGNQLVHTIEEKIMRLPTYGPNQVQDYATLVQKHSNASIYVNPKKFVKQTSIDFSNAAHQKVCSHKEHGSVQSTDGNNHKRASSLKSNTSRNKKTFRATTKSKPHTSIVTTSTGISHEPIRTAFTNVPHYQTPMIGFMQNYDFQWTMNTPLQSSYQHSPYTCCEHHNQMGNMNPLLTPNPPFQSPYSNIHGNTPLSQSHMNTVPPASVSAATSSSGSDLNWLVQLLNKSTTTPQPTQKQQELSSVEAVENKLVNKLYLYSPNNTKKARHECKICGLGFPNKQLSTQHDLSNSALHKVKSSHHTTSHQVFSRSWFDQSDDEWASSSSNNTNVERVSITCLDASSIFGEGFSKSPSREYSSSDEEENTIHSTELAPLDQDDCAICGEAFERILDDSSGEWMIKNACLDPNSGSFVHCACLNPKKRAHSSDSNSSDKRIKYF